MKKDATQMLKLGGVLAIFAAVACVLLAVVNNITAPKIEKIKIENRNAALKEIFGENAQFSEYEGFVKEKITGVEVEGIYVAYQDNDIVGVAVQATGPTYDKATILTGITRNETVKSIKILSISDTSGFGQNALKPEFYTQFSGKSVKDSFNPEKGGDIDGLSGATITRRGVSKILKTSIAKANEALDAATTKNVASEGSIE